MSPHVLGALPCAKGAYPALLAPPTYTHRTYRAEEEKKKGTSPPPYPPHAPASTPPPLPFKIHFRLQDIWNSLSDGGLRGNEL